MPTGTEGNDVIIVRPGDNVDGLSGDDRFIWDADQGPRSVNGGAGFDTVELLAVFGHRVDLASGTVARGEVFGSYSGNDGNVINIENVRVGAAGGYRSEVYGTSASNTFTVDRFYDSSGDAASVYFDGRGGDDFLYGGAGADNLIGGDGNDVLSGGAGNDLLDGGSGQNSIDGGAGNDFINGGVGQNSIDGGSGVDVVIFANTFAAHQYGFANGAITVTGPAGTNNIKNVEVLRFIDRDVTVSNGALVFSGTASGETLTGTDSNDIINGFGGADAINGAAGDDVLIGGAGADTLTGGAGADTFRYLAASDSNDAGRDVIKDFQTRADRLDLSALNTTQISLIRSGASTYVFATTASGDFSLQVDGTLQGSDIIYGNNHSVFLIGSSGADTLIGGTQGDPIVGNEGDDIIIGGLGPDAMHGGAGRDTFVIRTAAESVAVNGVYDNYYDFTTGQDRIDVTALGTTALSVFRQADGSSVVFGNSNSGDFAFIAAGHAINGGDFVYGNNHSVYLIGSSVGETIIGSAYGDPIQGEGGDDILIGGLGADAIHGGAGRDTFVIRTAAESNSTGYDNYYDFTTGEDRIDLTALNTTAISVLRQTDGSSVIFGNSASGDFQFIAAGRAINGSDFIYGNNHSTYMVGSSAGETLMGSDNADPIQGNGGNDILIGAGGADSLEGGAGADIFRYLATSDSTLAFSDRIQDFQVGTDKIDLSSVHRSANDRYGIAYDGGGSFLYVDIGGDGTNDMLIQFKGATITAADITWGNGTGSSPVEVEAKSFGFEALGNDLPGVHETQRAGIANDAFTSGHMPTLSDTMDAGLVPTDQSWWI